MSDDGTSAPTSPPKSDDGSGDIVWVLLCCSLIGVIAVGAVVYKRKEIEAAVQKMYTSRGPQQMYKLRDPLNPMHLAEISLSTELVETPPLFDEFMLAARLDMVSQDTGSQMSKAFSDRVSKAIKERRENKHYLPRGIKTAKCYIDSDTGNDPAWQPLGKRLLQKCHASNGKFILLKTPKCQKVNGKDQWVGEPRLTLEQVKQKQMAICSGVDVREIEIRAGDTHEKVMNLVLSNVMMQKQKAEQLMAAERVHVLSTQYQATPGARQLALIANETLDGMPNTFCYNPNEGSGCVAEGRKDLADGMWIEIWCMMAQHASAKSNLTNKKRPGKVFQLILDGAQTSNQYQEENWAKEKGVEVVKIHADVSWTEEQLRPILTAAHARA